MPKTDEILTERRGETGGILWVTLNRPQKLNALTFPLLADFREICIEARADRSDTLVRDRHPHRDGV